MTNIKMPVPMSIHSIFSESEIGPKISILRGIMEVEIMVVTPNTRPK